MHRDSQPETLDEWITAARTEARKFANRMSWKVKPTYYTDTMHAPRHNGHNKKWVHPNDRTVPMDVDTPVRTFVRRAVTSEDKRRLQQEGRCFYCEQQGHMARECPKKKHQQSSYRQSPSSFGKPTNFGTSRFGGQPQKPTKQRFRKFNKPRGRYTPKIRAATVEEVYEEDEEGQEENEVTSLVVRTNRLDADQREQWVEEMKAMGINF
jgi:hypothetical protein